VRHKSHRLRVLIAASLAFFICIPEVVSGHMLVISPERDVVISPQKRDVWVRVWFSHPMEKGPSMDFKVEKSGIVSSHGKSPLSWKEYSIPKGAGERGTVSAYKSQVTIGGPGVYQVFVEQTPYFEPAEEVFIKQVAKTYIEAFNLEAGWETPLGLDAEIVPLTRPFGLWEGSLFCGRAMVKGQPCRNCRVEMEYLNQEDAELPIPALATYVTHTDSRGIFQVTLPWRGWWGIAVLGDGGYMKGPKGKEYPVELDSVIWLKAYPKPEGVR